MKGKIVNLQWVPKYNLHSGRDCQKIKSEKKLDMPIMSFILGYGFYQVSKYIPKMTETIREETERLLP